MSLHRSLLALILIALLAASASTGRSPAQAQTSGWHLVAPLPVPVTGLAAATGLDGRVYAFGGALASGRPINRAEVYDPGGNTWTAIAPLPVADGYMSATVAYNGKIYLVGGWDGQQSTNLVEAYDPATNTWSCSVTAPGCVATNLASLPTPRANLGVTWGPGGTIWAIGGFTSVPVATVEVYDIRTNRWSVGPQFAYPAAGVSASAGPDGTIYAFGGHDAQNNYHGQLFALPPGASAHLTAARWTTAQSSESTHQAAGSSFQPLAIPAGLKEFLEYQENKRAEEETERALSIAMVCVLFGSEFGSACYAGKIKPLDPSFLASRRTNQQQATHVAVLISGGPPSSGPPVSNAVDLWDVTGSAIYSLPPMLEPRTNGVMVLGGDGTFYVMGGDDGNGTLYSSVEAYTLPPPPTLTPTATISPTASPAPMPTASPTPAPTATPIPTSAPAPLTVRIKVKSHRVAAGHQQQITITTFPRAQVAITVTYPNGKKLRHSGTAGATGTLTWRFKEPGGFRAGLKVKLAVTVTDASGRTAHASGNYTTG